VTEDDASRLAAGTRFAGLVRVLDAVDSTIDACRALADEGGATGTVVIAREQRLGRGQRGNRWYSPRGCGLYLSALLRPGIEPREAPALTACLGLAAGDALARLGVACELKSPNDLLAVRDGRWVKLGGLLVDVAVQGSVLRHAILSVGLDVAPLPDEMPAELRGTVASIDELTGRTTSIAQVADELLRALDVRAAQLDRPDARALLCDEHARRLRVLEPGALVAAGAP
jgi:BirA family biotin operon repressor/biotin-[acetyl-CoA-carboxylase] ligase